MPLPIIDICIIKIRLPAIPARYVHEHATALNEVLHFWVLLHQLTLNIVKIDHLICIWFAGYELVVLLHFQILILFHNSIKHLVFISYVSIAEQLQDLGWEVWGSGWLLAFELW